VFVSAHQICEHEVRFRINHPRELAGPEEGVRHLGVGVVQVHEGHRTLRADAEQHTPRKERLATLSETNENLYHQKTQ
jgi:hypothetical protein